MQERCKLDARVGEDSLEKEMATQSSVLAWYSVVYNLRILPVFVNVQRFRGRILTFYLTLNFIMWPVAQLLIYKGKFLRCFKIWSVGRRTIERTRSNFSSDIVRYLIDLVSSKTFVVCKPFCALRWALIMVS